jgi:hypothetical protein
MSLKEVFMFSRLLWPRLSAMTLGALMVIVILATQPARAQTYRYPDACYVCKTMRLWTQDCVYPRSGDHGMTRCSITVLWLGVSCATDGYECEYDCFGPGCNPGGGSGGGGGGGGGGGCNIQGGSCPPECFDCGGQYY